MDMLVCFYAATQLYRGYGHTKAGGIRKAGSWLYAGHEVLVTHLTSACVLYDS